MAPGNGERRRGELRGVQRPSYTGQETREFHVTPYTRTTLQFRPALAGCCVIQRFGTRRRSVAEPSRSGLGRFSGERGQLAATASPVDRTGMAAARPDQWAPCPQWSDAVAAAQRRAYPCVPSGLPVVAVPDAVLDDGERYGAGTLALVGAAVARAPGSGHCSLVCAPVPVAARTVLRGGTDLAVAGSGNATGDLLLEHFHRHGVGAGRRPAGGAVAGCAGCSGRGGSGRSRGRCHYRLAHRAAGRQHDVGRLVDPGGGFVGAVALRNIARAVPVATASRCA